MRFTRGTFSVYLEFATWSELRTFWQRQSGTNGSTVYCWTPRMENS
jgi:hypothetical protein